MFKGLIASFSVFFGFCVVFLRFFGICFKIVGLTKRPFRNLSFLGFWKANPRFCVFRAFGMALGVLIFFFGEEPKKQVFLQWGRLVGAFLWSFFWFEWLGWFSSRYYIV